VQATGRHKHTPVSWHHTSQGSFLIRAPHPTQAPRSHLSKTRNVPHPSEHQTACSKTLSNLAPPLGGRAEMSTARIPIDKECPSKRNRTDRRPSHKDRLLYGRQLCHLRSYKLTVACFVQRRDHMSKETTCDERVLSCCNALTRLSWGRPVSCESSLLS